MALTPAPHSRPLLIHTRPPPTPGAGPEAGAGAAPSGDGQAKKKDDGVIDAEYVDVEDKK